MKAVIVCVEYADILGLTLPYNRHHFDKVVVVTTPQDFDTQSLANRMSCEIVVTESFYEHGAIFNKWRGLEEGLDAVGRDGWLCILDADILFPQVVSWFFEPGNLYTPRRRFWPKIDSVPSEKYWKELARDTWEGEFPGYTQIFHGEDPVLGPAPWHQIDWRHAGGADTFFQKKWPENKKIRPPFEVVHLGLPGKNWCGRTTPYADGSVHPDARARAKALSDFLKARTPGPDEFKYEKLSGK